MHKLLDLAPTGFPSQKSLHDVLPKLHHKHRIFPEVKSDPQITKIATVSADNLQIFTKHVYDFAQAGCDNPDIKSLTGETQLPMKRPAKTKADFELELVLTRT